MMTNEFVYALTALAPAVQELEGNMPGLTTEDYELWRAEFIPQALAHPRPLVHGTNTELDALLSGYDLSYVCILGDIQFYEEPWLNDEHKLLFAGSQAGVFSVDSSGTVWLNDEFGQVRCARTAADFYAALLVFSEYTRDRLTRKIDKQDREARESCAQRAAAAAKEPQAASDYLHILNTAC